MVDMVFLSNFFEFWQLSFGLSIIRAHMKLNGPKGLSEIEQRNSEKNQTFLVLNDKWFFLLVHF